MSITKAIFPVAGLGTRFLPATKAQPKPNHWVDRKRSDLTKNGNKAATQKGEVYKNTVSREAVVYCRPM